MEHHHSHEHHHHHEPGECLCGHEHHHCEGEGTRCLYQIHGHLHEGAAVVSGRVTLTGGMCCNRDPIAQMLENIAIQVKNSGGIIGHIKASATVRKTMLFSVTKEQASVTPCEGEETELAVTAIAFSVKVEMLEEWMRNAFKGFDEGSRT